MLNMGVFCLGMLLPAALISESGCEADERAIRGVLDRFMDAWNCHDAKAFALVFSPDADVTNWRGTVVSGRSGVEQMACPGLRHNLQEQPSKVHGDQDPVHPPGCCGSRCELGDDGSNGSGGQSASRRVRGY